MTFHSTLSPFEKRTLERELKSLGLPSNMALAATRVASKHMDVAMEVRRLEWARAMVHLSYQNHQNQNQDQQEEG